MTDVFKKLKSKRSTRKHLKNALEDKSIRKTYNPSRPAMRMESAKQYAQRLALESSKYQIIAVQTKDETAYVAFGVPGPIITPFGDFFVIPAEVVDGKWGVHYLLFSPDLQTLLKRKGVIIRINSGCFSGMVLGDTTCDCLQQFQEAQKICSKKGGIVIEIPGQDGRGWSEYKMAVQRLMKDYSLDTIEAATLFYGHKERIDRRTYDEAAIILRALGFNKNHTFELATDNPAMVKAFTRAGFKLTKTNKLQTKISSQAKKNIRAKKRYWKEIDH